VQVTKGIRRMSRCQETMKDVVGCDKPRQAADKRYSLGFPNGKTHHINVISDAEYIGAGRQRGELTHLSTRRKRKQ